MRSNRPAARRTREALPPRNARSPTRSSQGIALEAKGILGAYYFEDGLDNINNAGNRSQKYKSVHFLDPDYWTE